MEEPRSSSSSRQGSFALPKEIGSRKVKEVWKEIAAGGKGDDGDGSGLEMTLEDFLARNGVIREEDVRVPSGSAQGGFGLDSGVGGEFRSAPAVAAAAAAGDGRNSPSTPESKLKPPCEREKKWRGRHGQEACGRL